MCNSKFYLKMPKFYIILAFILIIPITNQNIFACKKHSKNNVIAKKMKYATPIDSTNPVLREQISDDSKNPNPIPNNTHIQTEPPVGKDYIEKWIISSSKTLNNEFLENEYMLSPSSYIIFVSATNVIFKLNEFFPEQRGTFTQNSLEIKINLFPIPDCKNCINEIKIQRKSTSDQEFLMLFSNKKQTFTILKK